MSIDWVPQLDHPRPELAGVPRARPLTGHQNDHVLPIELGAEQHGVSVMQTPTRHFACRLSRTLLLAASVANCGPTDLGEQSAVAKHPLTSCPTLTTWLRADVTDSSAVTSDGGQ